MKAKAYLLTVLTVIAFSACSDEPKPPPPEPQAQEEPKGTTIKVGEGGVEVQSEEGDVKVSPDSASIVLPPKK